MSLLWKPPPKCSHGCCLSRSKTLESLDSYIFNFGKLKYTKTLQKYFKWTGKEFSENFYRYSSRDFAVETGGKSVVCMDSRLKIQ